VEVVTHPRGSEWRKWDLHVHTPFSLLNQGFEGDFDRYARELLQRAAAKRIAAVGITDYFTVDGYDAITRLVRDEAWLATLAPEVAEHARSMLILANVELRGFTVTDAAGRDSRVNYHLLFADELSADEIREDFLARLHFTAGGIPGGPPERWALTSRNLETLGARLKQQHAPFQGMSDLVAGMNTAIVNHEEAADLLSSQRSRFEGRCLLVAPIDEDLAELPWDGQGHQARKAFIQSVHMIFSANRGTREFALGRRHPSVEAFVAEFGVPKPCLHGSDAHDFEHLFEPDERRYCWIKGDPTWRGLVYLLNEPEDRVFIGNRPPQLDAIEGRSARTMRFIEIRRTTAATTTERWFDNYVPLNPGICAIIGNRGNGKSALAEVLALLSDTKRAESFSFLTRERFRSPRAGKASQFEATVTWGDDTSIGPRTLDRDPISTAVERVRYIGQGFLDDICNEIDEGESSRFYQELQDVIFSHVSEPDRRGQASLAALLSELGVGIEQSIALLQEELSVLNKRVLELSTKLEPDYRAELEARLGESRRVLAAHDATRPVEVGPPAEDETEQQIALREAIEGLRATLIAIDATLTGLIVEDGELANRAATASRLIDRVRATQAAVDGLMGDAATDAQAIGIEISDVIGFTVDTSMIDVVLAQAADRRSQIRAELDAGHDGAAGRRAAAAAEMAVLEEQLSLPQLRRQEYLNALARWETDRATMVGDSDHPNSLEGLAAQVAALEELPALVASVLARRRIKVREIYEAKLRLKNHYQTLHGPVSEFLASNPLVGTDALKLEFTADVVESGFTDKFLAMIDQRRLGPFAGVDEGRAKLDGLLSEVDWRSTAQVEAFPDLIADLMSPGGLSPRRLSEQLRHGLGPQDVLDFLADLAYLQPTYTLTWDGRAVSELSPGERGNLLLIFYLLVDRNDIPLVIDQPEENLDNQTVYRTLVPCMRDAKTRRQIVVVTHNPNLAVVCDADQVIYSAIQKDGSNAVTYETGSIENPDINSRLVDVLEGTAPAFNERAAKYLLA
jgi:predicted ATPase